MFRHMFRHFSWSMMIMLVSQLDHVSLQVPRIPRPQMLGPAQSIECLGCKGHGTWSPPWSPLKHLETSVVDTEICESNSGTEVNFKTQITQWSNACLWLKQGSCERGSVIETLEWFLCHATGSNSAAQIQMRKSIWIWCCCCCVVSHVKCNIRPRFLLLMLTRPKIPKSMTIVCKP